MIFIHSIFLAEGRSPSDAAVMTKFEHEARIEGWLGWVYSCTHRTVTRFYLHPFTFFPWLLLPHATPPLPPPAPPRQLSSLPP
jgi:hypothetical protein